MKKINQFKFSHCDQWHKQISLHGFVFSFVFLCMLASINACSYILGDNLIIKNSTRYPLYEVVIQAEGEDIWRGEILAREELDLNFRVPKEGMITITAQWQGREVKSGDSWSYVSPAVSNEHRFQLKDDGRFYDF